MGLTSFLLADGTTPVLPGTAQAARLVTFLGDRSSVFMLLGEGRRAQNDLEDASVFDPLNATSAAV